MDYSKKLARLHATITHEFSKDFPNDNVLQHCFLSILRMSTNKNNESSEKIHKQKQRNFAKYQKAINKTDDLPWNHYMSYKGSK